VDDLIDTDVSFHCIVTGALACCATLLHHPGAVVLSLLRAQLVV
jgi:hypothetical protein